MRVESSLAVLLTALLLVGSVPAAALTAPPASPDDAADRPGDVRSTHTGPHVEALSTATQASPDHNETARTADTIYVTDDGDLVLAYRNEDGDGFDGRFGVNVSEGLVHVLLANETDSNVTGNLAATLTRERFVGNGSLVTERPEAVESLDLQASTVQTDEQSRTDVSLQATLRNDSAAAGDVSSLSTKGRLRVTPSTYEFSGAVTAQGGETASAPSEYGVTITETDSGYRLDVRRNDTVSEYFTSRWDTRENATRTLEAQYNSTARSLNGTVDVTLTRYDFVETDNGTYRIDIAYTVEYRGVHEAVADRLTESLAESQNLTLTEAEASDISDRVQAFDVDRISFSTRTRGDRVTMAASIELANYDALSRAVLDIAASSKNLTAEQRQRIADARARLDAIQASGLVRTANWGGTLSTDSQTVTVDFGLEARSANWQAYVEELRARDLGFTQIQYELTATTNGDDIETTVSVTVEDDKLVADILQPNPGATAGETESAETLRDLRAAGFERAKLNASLTEQEVTMEMAANFENMSALQDSLSEAYAGEVQSIVGRTEGGQQVTYVRVTGAVGSDPSEDDVRALPVADEDTTIKMPDEWDREFPSMATETARAYLGYEPAGSDGGNATADGSDGADGTAAGGGSPTGTSTDAGVAGFGLGVALVALAGAALLFGRR